MWYRYIVNGAAGHYDGLDSFTLPYKSYHRFGLATADGVYGWSKLTFHNCTHMTHDFIASKNNTVLDSATLFKAHKGCGVKSSSTSSTSSTSKTSTTSTTSRSTTSKSTTSLSSVTVVPTTTSSSSVQMTTSTVFSTIISTVTACPATVTNCPIGKVVTQIIELYTVSRPHHIYNDLY